jgi:hypothetical protein
MQIPLVESSSLNLGRIPAVRKNSTGLPHAMYA